MTVDEQDYEWVARQRWLLSPSGYAHRSIWVGQAYEDIRLHRYLVGCKRGDGLWVDHINRDRLDNRRSNLRVITPQQSNQNTASRGLSAFRGVAFERRTSLWRASAQLDGRYYWLGRHSSEADAAEAAHRWRIAHMPFAVE